MGQRQGRCPSTAGLNGQAENIAYISVIEQAHFVSYHSSRLPVAAPIGRAKGHTYRIIILYSQIIGQRLTIAQPDRTVIILNTNIVCAVPIQIIVLDQNVSRWMENELECVGCVLPTAEVKIVKLQNKTVGVS